MIGAVTLGSFNVTIGGLPAARKLDLAGHVGAIVGGASTVAIGGPAFSAARMTDSFVCPMFDGPKPHVGGMIMPPCCMTVTIEKLPAARISDMTICSGPPIPSAGGGGGGGGGKEGGDGSARDEDIKKAKETPETDCRGKPLHDQEASNSCVVASARMIMAEMGPVERDPKTGKILKDKNGKPIRKTPSEKDLTDKAKGTYPLNYDPESGSDPYGIPAFLDENGVPGSESRTFSNKDLKDKDYAIEDIRMELNGAIAEKNRWTQEFNKYRNPGSESAKAKKAEAEKNLAAADAEVKRLEAKIAAAEQDPARKKAHSDSQDAAIAFLKDATDPGPPTGKPAMVGVDRADPKRDPPQACHRLVVDGVVGEPPNQKVLLRDPIVPAQPAPGGCIEMSMADFKKELDPKSPVVSFPPAGSPMSLGPPRRANRFGLDD